ncbi:UNVERIFIED_CONTAM: hypothetical protein K2H54_074047 [Gekko kuhli]
MLVSWKRFGRVLPEGVAVPTNAEARVSNPGLRASWGNFGDPLRPEVAPGNSVMQSRLQEELGGRGGGSWGSANQRRRMGSGSDTAKGCCPHISIGGSTDWRGAPVPSLLTPEVGEVGPLIYVG